MMHFHTITYALVTTGDTSIGVVKLLLKEIRKIKTIKEKASNMIRLTRTGVMYLNIRRLGKA